MYEILYISIIYGLGIDTQNDKLPVGLIAQLVEDCTGIAEVRIRVPTTIWRLFQMTVESNYMIAIATLSGWLKRLAPVFQPMRSKTKTNRTMCAGFFPRFERVTGNC